MTRALDAFKRAFVLVAVVAGAGLLLTAFAPRQALLPAAAAAQEKPKLIPLEKLPWQRPMLLDQSEETGEVDPGEEAKPWITLASFARGDGAIVPAFRPSAVGVLFIYRSFCDTRAVYIINDPTIEGKAGSFHFRTPHYYESLAGALGDKELRVTFNKLLGNIPQAELAQYVLENQMAGQLSHDEKMVYVVSDLALPVPTGFDEKKRAQWGEWASRLIMANDMRAYSLATGKIVWEIGGENAPHPLPNSHFLAAPLVHHNKLLALNETNKGEQRLVVIDTANGKVDKIHPVDSVPNSERFLINQRRRLYAAQLLVDGNLLVCIPHAGKAFGIDIGSRNVVWTFEYQKNPPAPQNLGAWNSPVPFVHDGKLVFTASDDDHVHCLTVKDGKPLWKVKRADDLYLAGIASENVLLAGQNGCRALSLKTGAEVWKLATGTPCGIGALDKTKYLLPLRKGAFSGHPEIAHVDVENGKLIGVSPVAEMPGNLLIHGDFILSQSATAVMGYKR